MVSVRDGNEMAAPCLSHKPYIAFSVFLGLIISYMRFIIVWSCFFSMPGIS
jgi:hypothetical protein